MAQQQGIEESRVNYYDIMVIGKTGSGKSTTTDKILIANPTEKDYSEPQYREVHSRQDGQFRVDDISMWLLSQADTNEASTRLKSLVHFRSKEKSHEGVNKTRDVLPGSPNEVFKPTTNCEVISNDTSKVRILDVPGFFGFESTGSSSNPEDSLKNICNNSLSIMRKILHIQTALGMKFQRILYFLPVRGPLERADGVLQSDLQIMAHYFGKTILKCMVIVATVSAHISKLPIDEDQKFPAEIVEKTKYFFKKAMDNVFQPSPNDPLEVPPIVFISLTDSCDTILTKIKTAPVAGNNLLLEFDPSTCADCGMKIGKVRDEEVACCFGEDWSNAVPYNESTCHPLFVPKYSTFDKIRGGVVYVVTLQWARGGKWPVFEGEVCVGCQSEPNSFGCSQVGKEIQLKKGVKIKVKHTNKVVETVADDQVDDEGGCGEPQAAGGDQNIPEQHSNSEVPIQRSNGTANGPSPGEPADVAHVHIHIEQGVTQSPAVQAAPHSQTPLDYENCKGT